MKPFVFMCLTIAGLLVGLFIGVDTAPSISGMVSTPLVVQRRERAGHMAFYSLVGAALGAGLGWAACKLGDKQQ
jgi:hypothetical protein